VHVPQSHCNLMKAHIIAVVHLYWHLKFSVSILYVITDKIGFYTILFIEYYNATITAHTETPTEFIISHITLL
jgi:hypothetical protein